MIATFFLGFQSSDSVAQRVQAFHMFCVVKIWHQLISFALATISYTLQPIL